MAEVRHYNIDQNADWTTLEVQFTDDAGTPIDVTSYDAQMYLKRDKSQTTADFQLTKTNGKIVLTGAQGLFNPRILAADALTLSGLYYFDLLATSPTGAKTCLLEGTIYVDPAVTK